MLVLRIFYLHAKDRMRPCKSSLLLVEKTFDGINGVGCLDALDSKFEGVLLDSLVKIGAIKLPLIGRVVRADRIWDNVL